MANHMANQSRVRRMLILFLLAFGTTAMYSLPYLKSSFYDPMQQALGLTHIEIGNLLSLYGLIGMFSYFFGGWFADRFSLRNLITFSLIASGSLGFWFATFPSYNTILLIHILWGVTTILTFFAASIKVVRMQGTEKEQGRIFGFYEGLSAENYVDKVIALVRAMPTINLSDTLIGVTTLLVLIYWPKLKLRLPGHLPAVIAGMLVMLVLSLFGMEAATIGSRFSYTLADGTQGAGIPPILPQFILPWNLPTPDGKEFVFSWATITALMPRMPLSPVPDEAVPGWW